MLLKKIEIEKLMNPCAVVGFWPANRSVSGEDIEIFEDDSRSASFNVLHMLRQQEVQDDGVYKSLADYIAPKGVSDYIGMFACTAGTGLEAYCASLEASGDDYTSILVKSLADRIAESLAEKLHEDIRTLDEYWGYNHQVHDLDAKLAVKYQGIRPAPGYPSQPDHTESDILFSLLNATSLVGISLTESKAMTPSASVSGLYLSHPDAKYFQLGNIDKDQILNYAARKSMPVEEVEKWLSQNLSYERV